MGKPKATVFAILGMVLQIPTTIIAGALIGFWLDRLLGTFPWLLLFCFAGGVYSAIAIFLAIRKMVMRDGE